MRFKRTGNSYEFESRVVGSLAVSFLMGWVFFLTYAAIRPGAWPYIGLWPAFGISVLFTYATNRLRREK